MITRKSLSFALAFVHLSLGGAVLAACGDDGADPIPPSVIYDAAPTPPDAAPVVTCDPLTQDCADSSKCSLDLTQTMTGGSTTSTWGATCRAQTGTVALGAHCTRVASGAPGVGKDDCDKGGYCTAIGDLGGNVDATARVCRSFCNSSSSCSKGEGCFSLTTMLQPKDVGLCVPTCTILGAGCTGTAWCTPTLSLENSLPGPAIGTCTASGPAAVGAPCDSTTTCVSGSTCITSTLNGVSTSACRAVCDLVAPDAGPANAPCATGTTCKALNGFPADWGFCSPS
jgi:hypothetical protein